MLFSVGIFLFLIICIAVFTAVTIMFARTGKPGDLKLGEKIMLAWIFFGILAGVVLGVVQLLQGQLI